MEPARTQDLRRVVTTHDQSGKAQILSDGRVFGSPLTDLSVAGVPIWKTNRLPVNNSGGLASVAPRDLKFRGGSVFQVIELEPGFQTTVHRSQSIDYCMVLSGELELVLYGAETVRLSPGEAVVQRGTWHEWRNPDKQTPARFLMCMIEAKPMHHPQISDRSSLEIALQLFDLEVDDRRRDRRRIERIVNQNGDPAQENEVVVFLDGALNSAEFSGGWQRKFGRD